MPWLFLPLFCPPKASFQKNKKKHCQDNTQAINHDISYFGSPIRNKELMQLIRSREHEGKDSCLEKYPSETFPRKKRHKESESEEGEESVFENVSTFTLEKIPERRIRRRVSAAMKR